MPKSPSSKWSPPRSLSGRLCELVPFEDCYVSALLKYLNDPEVVQHLPKIKELPAAKITAWLGYVQHSQYEYIWSIVSRTRASQQSEQQCFLGISFLKIFEGSSEGLGGTIIANRQAWGRGIGVEAKTLQLRFAFNILKVDRMFSTVQPGNDRAVRLLIRCGYIREQTPPACMQHALSHKLLEVYSINRGKWLFDQQS